MATATEETEHLGSVGALPGIVGGGGKDAEVEVIRAHERQSKTFR